LASYEYFLPEVENRIKEFKIANNINNIDGVLFVA